MRFLLALALFVSMTMLARGAEDKPEFAGKMTNAADKFEAETTKDGTVWKITSTKGIGGAFVKVTKGKMPDKVTVQFAKLKNMESLKVSVNIIALKGRLEAKATKSTLYFDAKGTALKSDKDAVYTIVIEKTKNGIDVTISAGKKAPAAKFYGLIWVDNFR